jgi:hypothetical protein
MEQSRWTLWFATTVHLRVQRLSRFCLNTEYNSFCTMKPFRVRFANGEFPQKTDMLGSSRSAAHADMLPAPSRVVAPLSE